MSICLSPALGGRAKPSHPRSAIKGDSFEKCVLDVFERIDFKKPRTGKTMVSCSLKFSPEKSNCLSRHRSTLFGQSFRPSEISIRIPSGVSIPGLMIRNLPSSHTQ